MYIHVTEALAHQLLTLDEGQYLFMVRDFCKFALTIYGLYNTKPEQQAYCKDIMLITPAADMDQYNRVWEKYVFTLVGGHISPILVGAQDAGLRVIDCRDERNAVFAADAVAAATSDDPLGQLP